MARSRAPTARQPDQTPSELEFAARRGEVEEIAALTTDLRVCEACGTSLHLYDNFCRWCGAAQTTDQVVDLQEHASSIHLHQSRIQEQVQSLTGPYHPVSGPLVDALVKGVRANLAEQFSARITKSIICGLMWATIWLTILLLSSLDAYSMAESILRKI